jgi:hypothetical protein
MVLEDEFLHLLERRPVGGDVREHAAGLPLARDVVQGQQIEVRDHTDLEIYRECGQALSLGPAHLPQVTEE